MISAENSFWNAFFVMAYPYYETKKYLRDPVFIALGLHAYRTG